MQKIVPPIAPEIVFFGLIFGAIFGPPITIPVSIANESVKIGIRKAKSTTKSESLPSKAAAFSSEIASKWFKKSIIKNRKVG